MAEPWTLAYAQEMLAAWLAAEQAVAVHSQSYRIGDQELTRADLPTIARRIAFWRKEVDRLQNSRSGGIRVFRVIPRDR